MPCNPCRADSHVIEGVPIDCPKCGELRWYNGVGDRLYSVPGLSGGRLPIVEVSDPRESLIKELSTPRRTRLISRYRDKEKEHIESLLGLEKPKGKPEEQLEAYRKCVSDLGLSITPLVEDSEIKESEPLLIHWAGHNPFEAFPNIGACPDGSIPPNSGEDPNWGTLHFDVNMHESLFPQPFRKSQRKAIEQVLRFTGSRQIVALPTGYGKTRIVQTVTNVLRKSGKGPTLMISPIIALRDDQREAFQTAFAENSRVFGRDFIGRFITAEDSDVPEIIDDLIEDKLDILCCGPEHILNPGQGMSWIETFMRMRNPFSTLVIDEAHLVGDWGSTFRPHFLLLGQLKDRLIEMNPDLRVILQSATITQEEGRELEALFGRLKTLEEVREDDVRDDLFFSVKLEEAKNWSSEEGNNLRKTIDYERNTLDLLEEYQDMPGRWRSPWEDKDDRGRSPLLIYSAEKKSTKERIFPSLKEGGAVARLYTGDTDENQRDRLRRLFKDNRIDAMAATSAFGMGIDKPDVWLIGYLGLPFTLKGLYQGFGRAARGSNWDHGDADRHQRNGCCIAVIPDVNPKNARPFKPELRFELAAERLWDMMMSDSTISVGNRGYMIAPPLEDLHAPLWLQSEKEVSDYLKKSDFQEESDDEDEEDDSTGWIPPTQDEWDSAQRGYDLGRKSRQRANLRYRMWSLACLQRASEVSIMGFYPNTLYDDRSYEGASMKLKDALEEGGHDLVIKSLKKIKPPRILTPEGQNRNAVIRFDEPATSWSDILRMLRKGHDDLKERHTLGNKVLARFLDEVRDGVCLRKAFSPAIGAKSTLDCKALLKRWANDEENNRNPPVPCGNCLESNGIPELKLSVSGSTLWIDDENLRLLKGEEALPPEPKNPLEHDWDNTGDPIDVIQSKPDGDSNIWLVKKNRMLDEFYDFYGKNVEEIEFEELGEILQIKHVPDDTEWIVVFEHDGKRIGRFATLEMKEELEEWGWDAEK